MRKMGEVSLQNSTYQDKLKKYAVTETYKHHEVSKSMFKNGKLLRLQQKWKANKWTQYSSYPILEPKPLP